MKSHSFNYRNWSFSFERNIISNKNINYSLKVKFIILRWNYKIKYGAQNFNKYLRGKATVHIGEKYKGGRLSHLNISYWFLHLCLVKTFFNVWNAFIYTESFLLAYFVKPIDCYMFWIHTYMYFVISNFAVISFCKTPDVSISTA